MFQFFRLTENSKKWDSALSACEEAAATKAEKKALTGKWNQTFIFLDFLLKELLWSRNTLNQTTWIKSLATKWGNSLINQQAGKHCLFIPRIQSGSDLLLDESCRRCARAYARVRFRAGTDLRRGRKHRLLSLHDLRQVFLRWSLWKWDFSPELALIKML